MDIVNYLINKYISMKNKEIIITGVLGAVAIGGLLYYLTRRNKSTDIPEVVEEIKRNEIVIKSRI